MQHLIQPTTGLTFSTNLRECRIEIIERTEQKDKSYAVTICMPKHNSFFDSRIVFQAENLDKANRVLTHFWKISDKACNTGESAHFVFKPDGEIHCLYSPDIKAEVAKQNQPTYKK